jgi:hypothetical protein
MKLNLSFLLLAGLSLLGLGCSKGNVDLDNGGSQTLSVVIDQVSYVLPPRTGQLIELAPGPHTLEIRDSSGKTMDQTSFRIAEGGLINAARSPYIIWTDLYGDPALRATKLREEWIEIGKNSYFGEFERLDPEQYYVEKKWDYGLTEPFPDDLLGWEVTRDKWIVKKKLFREPDMVAAYQSIAKKP